MVCVGRRSVVCGVHCLLLTLYVLCCVAVSLCCGMAGGLVACLPLLSVFLFLFVLVFGVVRAQPSEHARYPRTPLRSLIVFSLLFSAPRFSLCHVFPVIVEWRCVLYHVSVCCVGMTATGSLSRSSPFFW